MNVGLSVGAPFKYLDEFCPTVDWEELHDHVSAGLAKSEWTKTVVSAGAHPDWKHLEMATYYRNTELLTERQRKLFEALPSKEAKIKFLAATTDTVHAFWLCFLRRNKIVDPTGIANKSVAADCYDTPAAKNFPMLMKLVKQLPLKSVGRIVMFMTEPNTMLVPHFDGVNEEQRANKKSDQFIWFQTRPGKKLFVMDDQLKRYYPEPDKHFLWFNEMDWHGTEPFERFSFSIRVEGEFDDRVR